MGEVDVIESGYGVDEVAGSGRSRMSGGDLDVEFGHVGIMEVVDLIFFGEVLELGIYSCLLYHSLN